MERIFFVIIGTLLAGAVSLLNGQELKPRGPHPRLFFTPDRTAKLQVRIQTEPSTAIAWLNVLAGAKSIEELSLAYRMTGEKRFAERARDAVRRLRWSDSLLLKRDPPWHAGLEAARSCYESAVAFDSIYDALTVEERKDLAQHIVDRGILPSLNDWVLGGQRIHTLDSMGHNWWSACVFGAGMAALAVMDEEPRAKDWLKRISDGSVEWLNFQGSLLDNKPKSFDAGGFFEDVNYASFAVSQYLLFRLAWNRALAAPAAPEIPFLEQCGDYFINVSYMNSARMMTLNFGDGGLYADGTSPVAMLWANGYRKPRYLWYLNELRGERNRAGTDRSGPLGLVFLPSDAELAAAPAAPDLPTSTLYADMGWAMLRSAWDKNATLLAVRSGYTWNHSHADAGSFILMYRGENLLIDSGKCSYGRPEYDGYYRQSRAHNVVLFNGEAQNPEETYFGSKFPGTVSHLMDAGDLKYVLADATGPTAHWFIRNYRHFLWLGDVILIIDDLKTFEPGRFEWLLHVDGTAKVRGLDLEVVKGDARVLVRPLFPMPLPDAGYPADFPEKMGLEEKIGLKDRHPETNVTYYSFVAPEPSRRTKFITAVLLVNETNRASLPHLERLEGTNYIGVRVRQGGTTTDIYLNLLADGRIMHRNANLKVNGWETDAYLTAITFPEDRELTDPDAATRYFIAQGSYLRREGKLVLDTLSKVFLVAERTTSGLNVLLQGQPVINAYFRSNHQPETLKVNGAHRQAPYDATTKLVKLLAKDERLVESAMEADGSRKVSNADNDVTWGMDCDEVGMAATIGADTELVLLPVAFPSYSLKGNPDPIPDSPDFEKFSDKAPQLPLVPKGVMNVALKKPVKTSTNLLDHCRTEQLTDGEKEGLDANVMEMKQGLQWVQVDLQGDYEIHAVVIWHRYSFRSIYKQVIVQVAQNEAFSKNVRTLFNNDRNNEAGFGVGSDLRYAETRYGRIIKGDGRPARFVRWYSNGSNDSALNTRLEMEVYGLPAKPANPAAK